MEDLSREFDGEPVKASPTYENAPPKRPEKLLLSENSDMPLAGLPKQSYSRALSSSEARESTTALANPSSENAAVGLNPRLARSRDDLDTSLSQQSKKRGVDEEVQQEMELLRAQLREANSRAEQAERTAEELARQLKFRTNKVTGKVSSNAADEITALKAENKGLKAELDEARSHIFSLQPYRKDLTPKEVGQDFDDLVNGITDWATNLMDPILDDDDRINVVLEAAKKRPADVQKLRRYLHSQADLIYGCMFPETDVDILIAITLRWLQDHVFQKILFGVTPDAVETISFVEGSMQTNVEPKRDLFALRTWRAETLNALICSSDYQRARQGRIRELTIEIASLFKVFHRDKDWNKHCLSCQESIIKPAVRLHEKLMTSTHHFYMDLDSYILWNSRQELEPSPKFVQDLPKLRCENMLQNRKPFDVAKLDPPPSKQQLHSELLAVATIAPALYMRQVGKGDVIKEPAVVRMQQVLVAWGPEDRREKFLADGDRTMLHRLCFSRRGREERAQEEDVWAPWKYLQRG
ncbi:hypothetical protein VTI28DRAFT_2261 [Corynascus sepedonium]